MILEGDCREKLKELKDNSVDSIVTDPPYELGFMGKSWDNTGIANDKDMWGDCLRVLKPGGYLLAFSGTRTYHRMASAIEDAGFEVRDMIEWVYGSGFPKSLNIGKAVDKLQGNDREDLGTVRAGKTALGQNSGWNSHNNTTTPKITKGTSEWEGWGTALKPAHEPICMARKPLAEKTVAENCLKYRTGGINIDECRVGIDGGTSIEINKEIKSTMNSMGGGQFYNGGINKENYGRFPANLIHDGSDEVVECFPNDSSRFFKSIVYIAKASKSERNKGCDKLSYKDGGCLDGNSDMYNNRKIGANPSQKVEQTKNNHPTVKPIALMEYLIKMVTTPKGTVLDPFMGSGSTGVACKNLKRDFIGIELEPEYIKIAKARIKSIPERLI